VTPPLLFWLVIAVVVPVGVVTVVVLAVLNCASVVLFAQRARQLVSEFTLTAETARTVGDICLRLDGLPLAIELAAARSKVLSPAMLLERLDYRLSLLVGGTRDLPARQRTLRSTIAWSYELLTPPEQRLLRALAVFAGGCTLDAAEAVCADAPPTGQSVLDGLTSLVNKNLLRADRSSVTQTRFAFLETIHEFALEQLQANSEADSVGARHAAHYLAVAEQDELANMQGSPAHVQWLERMKHEQDNFRTALRWAAAHGAAEVELRLAAALSSFWMMAGYAREGLLRLNEGLARSSAAPSRARAKALLSAAYMAILQGDCDAGQRLVAEAQPLVPESAEWYLRGLLLHTRAFLARNTCFLPAITGYTKGRPGTSPQAAEGESNAEGADGACPGDGRRFWFDRGRKRRQSGG